MSKDQDQVVQPVPKDRSVRTIIKFVMKSGIVIQGVATHRVKPRDIDIENPDSFTVFENGSGKEEDLEGNDSVTIRVGEISHFFIKYEKVLEFLNEVGTDEKI